MGVKEVKEEKEEMGDVVEEEEMELTVLLENLILMVPEVWVNQEGTVEMVVLVVMEDQVVEEETGVMQDLEVSAF